jgi:hypothetical protein
LPAGDFIRGRPKESPLRFLDALENARGYHKGSQVENRLSRKNGFDKSGASRRGDILSIPGGNFGSRFIRKRLEVCTFKAKHGEWQPKVFDWEGSSFHRYAMEDILHVHLPTTNWYNGDLLEIGTKSGNVTKSLQNGGKVLNITFIRPHKNSRIVGVKRSPQDVASATDLVEKTKGGSQLKNLCKRIDSKHEEERGERIALAQTAPMLDGAAGHPVKKHPRRGG